MQALKIAPVVALCISSMAPAAVETVIHHASGDRTTVTTDRAGTRAERGGGQGSSHDRGGRDADTHRDMVRDTSPGDRVDRPTRK